MAFAFAPDFRARLLSLTARLARGRQGEEGGFSGYTKGRSEFRDHRPYAPLDDLRDLDWHVFLRHEVLVTKTFQQNEAGEVSVILDRSASMGIEGSEKDRAAREVAAGLGFAALKSGAALEVRTLAEGGPVTLGRYRSARKLDALLLLLQELGPPSGPTWLEGLKHFPGAGAEGRVPFLITDLLVDPLPLAGFAALARGAVGGGLVMILTQEERRPNLRESHRLRDPEGRPDLEIADVPAFLLAYEVEVRAHEDAARRLALSHGFRFSPIDAAHGFEEIVLSILSRRG